MAGIFGDDINSRSDFLRELSVAQRNTQSLVKSMPQERMLVTVARQLNAISQWTADNRQPTLKERKSIVMGLQMFRAYETSGDEDIRDLTSRVGALNNYFLYWPSDEDAANPENDQFLSLADVLYGDN